MHLPKSCTEPLICLHYFWWVNWTLKPRSITVYKICWLQGLSSKFFQLGSNTGQVAKQTSTLVISSMFHHGYPLVEYIDGLVQERRNSCVLANTNVLSMTEQKLKQNHDHLDELVQERHNSSALAMEFCLSCTNPSISPREINKQAFVIFNLGVFAWTTKLLLGRTMPCLK